MSNKPIKKVAKYSDIVLHPHIECVIKNYDGKGRHMVECIEGYKFEGDRTIDIGTIKELCYCINNYLAPAQ